MAIKRSAKSHGSSSHKPAVSAPLRHVDIRAPQQMVAGEVYVGWLCKRCRQVIAIVNAAASGEDQLTAIKCPHCGDEDLYRWSGRGEQKYEPKSTG
jgi:hypothetical protein